MAGSAVDKLIAEGFTIDKDIILDDMDAATP